MFKDFEPSDPSVKEEEDVYGLGRARTVEEYQEFCGVDLRKKTIEPRAKLGGLSKEMFLDFILEMIANMKE